MGISDLSSDVCSSDLLSPVRSGIDPLRIGREEHLYTVPQLVCNECGVHARHQAPGCIGVTAVILAPPPALQSSQGGEKVFLRGAVRPNPFAAGVRSEERRIGKACVSTCR